MRKVWYIHCIYNTTLKTSSFCKFILIELFYRIHDLLMHTILGIKSRNDSLSNFCSSDKQTLELRIGLTKLFSKVFFANFLKCAVNGVFVHHRWQLLMVTDDNDFLSKNQRDSHLQRSCLTGFIHDDYVEIHVGIFTSSKHIRI